MILKIQQNRIELVTRPATLQRGHTNTSAEQRENSHPNQAPPADQASSFLCRPAATWCPTPSTTCDSQSVPAAAPTGSHPGDTGRCGCRRRSGHHLCQPLSLPNRPHLAPSAHCGQRFKHRRRSSSVQATHLGRRTRYRFRGSIWDSPRTTLHIKTGATGCAGKLNITT